MTAVRIEPQPESYESTPTTSHFCPKIRCRANRGRQRKNLNDIIG